MSIRLRPRILQPTLVECPLCRVTPPIQSKPSLPRPNIYAISITFPCTTTVGHNAGLFGATSVPPHAPYGPPRAPRSTFPYTPTIGWEKVRPPSWKVASSFTIAMSTGALRRKTPSQWNGIHPCSHSKATMNGLGTLPPMHSLRCKRKTYFRDSRISLVSGRVVSLGPLVKLTKSRQAAPTPEDTPHPPTIVSRRERDGVHPVPM